MTKKSRTVGLVRVRPQIIKGERDGQVVRRYPCFVDQQRKT